MALLIDAYNVLHCTHTLPGPYAMMSVTELCRLLEYSSWRGRGITVVCDGSPKPDEGEYEGEVELIYPGPGRDADTVIEQRIESSDAPRSLTVVSNDRRLQKAARRRKARSMTSEHFLQMLMRSISKPPGATDKKPSRIGSTEAWLDTFDIEDTTVKQIEQQIESEQLQPDVDPPSQQPGPCEKPIERDDEPPSKKPSDYKPKTETDYWLREFGFGPAENQRQWNEGTDTDKPPD